MGSWRGRQAMLLRTGVIGVAIIFVFGLFACGETRGENKPRDRREGVSIVLKADLSKVPSGEVKDRLQGLRENIEKRLEAYGAEKPRFQAKGEDLIEVWMPGVEDVDSAKKLVAQTALVEFREVVTDVSGERIEKSTGLTGLDLRGAYATEDPISGFVVNFAFNDRGARIFGDITARLAPARGRIAVYLDQQLLTEPVVRNPNLEGRGYIEGKFTKESAQILGAQLNSGSPPVPITVVSAELRFE